MPIKKPWTVMVYLAADNNLTNFGVDSLKRMKLVAGPQINIVAEFDSGPQQPTTRYMFDGGSSPTESIHRNEVDTSRPINAGDPNNLTAFIEWADRHYPAEHYFLIIWGHGSGVDDDFPHDQQFVIRHSLLRDKKEYNLTLLDGRQKEFAGKPFFDMRPVKGIAFVDNPKGFLTNTDLKTALESATKTIGRKLDIVGMDSCNMNMVEIAYEIRNSADFLVASQDEVPDASWPYDRFLQELKHNPELSPRALAYVTSSTYVSAYQDYIDQPVALSAIDLSFSNNVTDLFSGLIQVLRGSLGSEDIRKTIVEARQQARAFFGNLYVDLLGFCGLLVQNSQSKDSLWEASQKFLTDFRPFITSNEVSPGDSSCRGTSIYFPNNDFVHRKKFEAQYGTLDFSRATQWAAFVGDYLGQAIGSQVQPGNPTRVIRNRSSAKLARNGKNGNGMKGTGADRKKRTGMDRPRSARDIVEPSNQGQAVPVTRSLAEKPWPVKNGQEPRPNRSSTRSIANGSSAKLIHNGKHGNGKKRTGMDRTKSISGHWQSHSRNQGHPKEIQ